MDSHNTPNVKLPLALSHNERGRLGYEEIFTNLRDQRKTNVYYENAFNATTGRRTLYVVKRPGLNASWPLVSASSSDRVQLVLTNPVMGTFALSYSGGLIRAHTSGQSVTVGQAGSADYVAYADFTNLSGTPTAVVQTRRNELTAGRAFYASTITAWSEISASAYTGLVHKGKIEHLDGFAFQLAADNKIWNSDLNTLATWDSLGFISKSIFQDYPAGLALLGRTLLAFGQDTVEGFYNAGNKTGSPLSRIATLSARIGLVVPHSSPKGRHYAAQLGGVLYFTGREPKNDYYSLYAFNGARFEKVSTPFIEKIFQSNLFLSHVGAINIGVETGVAVSLVRGDAPTQQAMVFFPRLNEWVEWTSTAFQPVSDGELHAGIHTGTYGAVLGRTEDIGGDNPFRFRDGSASDEANVYDSILQFKLPKADNARESMAWCGLVGDTMSAGASATAGAYVQIAFSDNDYQSFSTERQIDLRTAEKRINRCGSYKDRVVRITHSGDCGFRIQTFIAKTL